MVLVRVTRMLLCGTLACCARLAGGITPNDVAGTNDSARIEAAFAAAGASGENEVVIPKTNSRTGDDLWLITRAILVPSNMRLVLDGCLVRLAPGIQDNIIRNAGTAATPLGGNTNLSIVGRAGAVLSGGTEAHFDPPGDKSGWRTIGILLYNTRHFTLENFTLEETQAWAVSMENGCAYGSVSNITFRNTNTYPNQDGVDVRKGCHHIVIENIFGVTGDDSVALTGLRSSLDGSVTSRMQIGDAYPAASDDIHDIVVRNVSTYMAGGNHTVRLLNHDGIRLYNIVISGVFDQSAAGQTRPRAGLKIGDAGYWTLSQNQLGETYNIFVTNLHSRATSAVLIQGTLKDAVLCDLAPFDGAALLSVGTMPTQNVIICESAKVETPAGPTRVEMNNAVLEVDLSPTACDQVTIYGDLSVTGDTRVELVTKDRDDLMSCRTNAYTVCSWSGIKVGQFKRTTNRAGWFACEDEAAHCLKVIYRGHGSLVLMR